MELIDIEKSLIKKYRKDIWSKFIKGIKEFELIENGDKIAVAISGGKDSVIMAKLLQQLQKYGPTKFELEFISMDPGFLPDNRKQLEDNCDKLGIPVKVKDSGIFNVLDHMFTNGETPCYMCARMRRGNLYAHAEELGCNKLALGHHFDDVIGTTLLNLFYASEFKTMLPKLDSDNYNNMQLIRPMVYIKEEAIIRWKNNSDLHFMDCGCTVGCRTEGSKRKEVKEFMKQYLKINPNADQSLFEAAKNVNLDQIMGYRKDGVKKSYLDSEK